MSDVFDSIFGQDRAVAQLRASVAAPVHAYLFVGIAGIGKRDAARAFGAALLCPDGGCGECDVCLRAVKGAHPDVTTIERIGASISVDQAREISRVANRSPLEGKRQVLIVTDIHLVEEAAPALLKTIEEPPEATVFVITAEHVTNDLATISSRCVRVEFVPLAEDLIRERLIAQGSSTEIASIAADVAGGSYERASLLAADSNLIKRRDLWLSIPDSLDGNGSTIVGLVDRIREQLELVVEPLTAQHEAEMEEFVERAKETGERATVKKALEDKQKREARRYRTDELRFGLATLAGIYRDRLLTSSGDSKKNFDALNAIEAANEALMRNPNEPLLLDNLLVQIESASY